MTTFVLVMVLALLLGCPLGHYMARVLRGGHAPLDALFLPVERRLYAVLGPAARGGMTWRGYALAFLLANAVLFVAVWLLLMMQGVLPLNPDAAPNMPWDLALHTMISFLTNTNQQHYSGQAQLSWLSQMVGIVGLQMITPMFGLAILAASMRGFFGGREAIEGDTSPAEGEERDLGNFWRDVIRAGLRVMLPLCLLWSLLLTSQGVPATLARVADVTPIDASAGMNCRTVRMAMIATRVSAKVGDSSCSEPGPCGATRFLAIEPAIISGISSTGMRPSSSTIAQVTFHHTVLSASPSKPEPLLAKALTYSYSTCEMPCAPGLELPVRDGTASATAEKPRIASGCSRISKASQRTSNASILRPNSSGVRPVIRPARNTASRM